MLQVNNEQRYQEAVVDEEQTRQIEAGAVIPFRNRLFFIDNLNSNLFPNKMLPKLGRSEFEK